MDKYNELLPTVKEAMGIADDLPHAKAYATDEELIDLLRRNEGDVGDMFRPVIEPTITFKSQPKPNTWADDPDFNKEPADHFADLANSYFDDPYADPVEDHWHRRLEKLAEQNEY